jgi:uncharacterized protein
MTRKLQISPELSLPIDAVTGTFCIVGIRGSGKSTTAVDIAEEMIKASQQIVVLDPKDDWWGIRSSANGKSEGLPITVLGGSHQDAPLEHTAGKLVAEIILNERISCILSMKHFSDGQRFRFIYDLADYLYRHCENPMHLFADEADQIAPQEKQFRIQKGDSVSESMMLSLVRRVIKQGRTGGLGISLITQSPATLDKRVMNMCETMIAMRVIGAQDFDAVERWFKVYVRNAGELEKVASQLPSLKAGQGIFYSPAWLKTFKVVQFRMAETFDSRKTPKVGQRRIEPKVLASIDLQMLSTKMAETIEHAKNNNPTELKRMILQLKQENQKLKERPAQTEIQTREIKVPVLNGELPKLLGAISEMTAFGNQIAEQAKQQIAIWNQVIATGNKVAQVGAEISATINRFQKTPTRIIAPIQSKSISSPHSSSVSTSDYSQKKMVEGERSILIAVAGNSNGLTRKAISVITGYKASTRNEYIKRQVNRGFLSDDGNRIHSTFYPLE